MSLMTEAARALQISRARTYARTGEGRRIRESANLSQREVGRAIGRTGVTICRWENGAQLPNGESAIRWIELLDSLQAAHSSEAAVR